MAGADVFDTAIALFEAGRLAEAEAACRQILTADPRHAGALLILGMARVQQGDIHNGLSLLDRSLGLNPQVPLGHCYRGLALAQLGRVNDALAAYRRAIVLQPDFQEAHYNAGHLLAASGHLEEALAAFDTVIRLAPDLPEPRCARAVVLSRLNRLGEAQDALDAVLKAAPDFVPALNLRANLFCEMECYAAALEDAARSLALVPGQAEAEVSRATALIGLRRPEAAAAALDAALQRQPDMAGAIMMRGVLHREAGRLDAALADGDRAAALVPGEAMVHVNRGATLMAMGRHAAALEALNRAASLAPRNPKVFATRALAMRHLDRYDEALADCDRALALDKNLPQVAGERVLQAAMLCHWQDRGAHLADLTARIRSGEPVSPWVAAVALDDPALHLAAAKRAAQPATAEPPRHPAHERIRVAYVSPDFHEHPSAHLIVEVLERHDRTQIETFAIALHDGPETAVAKRIAAAAEHFLSAGALADADLAAWMRRAEIDIAVDLGGHANGGRPGVFVARPASLTVNYAGHPGTLGADWADYILADGVVIPPGGEAHFSESVVRLPDCYLPSDTQFQAATAPTRAEAGLPDRGFVFCSFNASYKYGPETFGIWMRLLAKVPGSVLWLLAESATARRNLRNAAAARGVDPGRLVFAGRVSREAHLARLGCADLFLDTLPCNAHTTGCDALLMGVPLLTVMGRGFPARVAGSLLTAAGLSELIAPDLPAYEALATELAAIPARLAAVRDKLVPPRSALFDMTGLARHIEAAFAAMQARHAAGLPPTGFAVPRA